jgi:hypothetical protein
MGQGQGSVIVNQKAALNTPSGPPFALNSADNGLSVDPISRHVVLGQSVGAVGNPAVLLNSREVPMNFFDFAFGDLVNGRYMFLDLANFVYTFGDVDDLISGTKLRIDDINMFTQLGDVNDLNAGNKLTIDNITPEWSIGQRSFINELLIHRPNSGLGLSYFDENGNNPFLIPSTVFGGNTFLQAPDFSTGIVLNDSGSGSVVNIGDTGSLGNGTIIALSDPNQTMNVVDKFGDRGLAVDMGLGFYGLGDDAYQNNGSEIFIDDNNNEIDLTMKIGGTIGSKGLVLQGDPINIFTLGDGTPSNNGSIVSVNDPTNKIIFKNTANNVGIMINGVAGFNGTVAPPLTITVNNGIVTNVA